MKKPLLSLVLLPFCFSTAHAVLLVTDDFSSSNNGALAGSTPTTSVSGANWNAYTAYRISGGTLTRTGTGTIGSGVNLAGTLASGGVYNLSSTITYAANASPGNGVWGIGFSQTTDVFTSTSTPGGSPWIFLRENGAIEFRPLPSNNTTGQSISVAGVGTYASGTAYTLRLSIDTMASQWVVSAFISANGGTESQLDLNGSSAGLTYTYAAGANPNIRYVGITTTATEGIGSLDNFIFEGPALVPEPSVALLGAAGALGFALRRNRRR